MKKSITLSILLIFCLSAWSQDTEKRIRIGLELTPSLSWFKPDYKNVENDAIKLSNRIGVNLDYNFVHNYFVSTGVFLNWQKGRLKYSEANIPFSIDGDILYFNAAADSGKTVAIDYAMKYIEIPISLKLKTNEIGYMTYFAKFGLNTAFNISAFGNANQLAVEEADFSKEVNFINVGYHIGGGVEYSLSSDFIFTGGLTFQQGFIDVTTNTDGRTKDKTIMNNVRLNLGVFF
ncbi:MAG: porin family protein [Bacteroidota bacterium]|nr:porin family protein [Bacteroidota bacterium]